MHNENLNVVFCTKKLLDNSKEHGSVFTHPWWSGSFEQERKSSEYVFVTTMIYEASFRLFWNKGKYQIVTRKMLVFVCKNKNTIILYSYLTLTKSKQLMLNMLLLTSQSVS